MSQKSSDYYFNIAVIGPDDKLNEEFIKLTAEKHANVDGVHFYTGKVENIANINFWQPHINAESEKLVDLTYQTANAVIIVLEKKDDKIMKKYKIRVQENNKDILLTTFIMKRDVDISERARDQLRVKELLKKLTFSMIMKAEALKQKSIEKEIFEKIKFKGDEKAGEPIYYVDSTGIITTIKTKGSIPLYGDAPPPDPKKKKKQDKIKKL